MWKNRLERLKTGPGIAGFLLVIGPWLYRAIDVISNIDFLINLRSNENAKMAWSFVSSMSSHVGITILGIVWLTYLILRPEKKKTAHAQQGKIKGPLRIEFKASNWEIFEEELPPLGLSKAKRKLYWIQVHNFSETESVYDVGAEISRLDRLKPNGQIDLLGLRATSFPPYKLRFRDKGTTSVDLPPGRWERVDVISATNGFTGSAHFQIEGTGVEVYEPHANYRIEMQLTAKDLPRKTMIFFAHMKLKTNEIELEPEKWEDLIYI